MVRVLVNHLPPSPTTQTSHSSHSRHHHGPYKNSRSQNHDRETRIQQAIEERTKKRTTLRDLAVLYKIPHSTLSDRLRGIPSRHEAQQKYQAISPASERSLICWVDDIDANGFPPRLDFFKATAVRLISEEERPRLGSTWLRGFLNHHLELSSKFVSGLTASVPSPASRDGSKTIFKSYRCSFGNTTSFLIIYIIWTKKASSLGCPIWQKLS